MTDQIEIKPLKRVKPYKAKDPYDTVHQARSILKRLGIFVTEVPCESYSEKLFSCYLFLTDRLISPDNVKIGTNGKGLTPLYSLASAYGEMLERIENDYLIRLPFKPVQHERESTTLDEQMTKMIEKEDLWLDYFHTSDEILLSPDESVDRCFSYFKDHFGGDEQLFLRYLHISQEKANQLAHVPFYSVTKGDEQYLPVKVLSSICSSNGMCAGNTPQEALIQGICEIFERYVIKKIYYDHIVPPDIPHHYFEGSEIYERIQYIEKEKNIVCRIKDCSLNMGLPVLGLMLFHQDSGKYTFKLGADPSPITALERCLAEIYQRGYEHKLHAYNILEDTFSDRDGVKGKNRKELHYYLTLLKGIGKWPSHIFSEKASYSFNGFSSDLARDDQLDLDYLIKLVRDMGKDVLIRDVSYLGVPAFRVYIPGMSSRYEETSQHISLYEEYVRLKPLFFRLNEASQQEVEALSQICDQLYTSCYPHFNFFDIKYISPSKFKPIKIEYFLTLTFFYLKDYEKASQYIEYHIKRNMAASRDIFCLRDWLRMKKKNSSDETIKQLLSDCYGVQIFGKMEKRYLNRSRILKEIELPTCFQCSKCHFQSDCAYFEQLRFVKKMQIEQVHNPIDQLRIKEILQ